MKRNEPQFDQEKWKAARIKAGIGLASVLVQTVTEYWGTGVIKSMKAMGAYHGKPLRELETFSQFWTSGMVHAVKSLTDKEYTEKIRGILTMVLEGQFSESPYRRSYRSRKFGYYDQRVMSVLGRLIRAYYYKESVKELLFCEHETLFCYEYLLAYELRTGNPEITELVREAIFGDNTQIILSRTMIEAIIISGNESLLDDLLKLLLAARQQEGLRQQILESADKGSTQTFTKILKVCIDENLFRYSSAIRALDTWTGFGYTDEKAEVVKLCARLAYETLTDETKRVEYFDSKNTLEVYFSLWSQGCFEIEETNSLVERLLEDKAEDRNILGWIFVNRTDSAQFQMMLVGKHLAERNEKLLACMIGTLPFTWQLTYSYIGDRQEKERESVQNPDLPEVKAERKQMFYELKDVAIYIGNQKKTYSFHQLGGGKVSLENAPVMKCMMSLAGYDMDDELVHELIGLSELMSAELKQAFITKFLMPEKYEEHRAFLRKMLEDRSANVKEVAVKRLSLCKLDQEDMDRLACGLRSKSSSLRKAILSVLKSQEHALLIPTVSHMLEAADEYQNQAAVEMLMGLKDDHPDVLEQNRSALEQLRNRKLTTQTEILLEQLIPREVVEVVYTPENGFGLYDPSQVKNYIDSLDQAGGLGAQKGFLTKLFRKTEQEEELLSAKQIKELLPSRAEFDQLCACLNMVFNLHANEEFEVTWDDGSRHKVLFGDQTYAICLPESTGYDSLGDPGASLKMIPFFEEFFAAFGAYGKDLRKMLGLYRYAVSYYDFYGYSNTIPSLWFAPIAATGLNADMSDWARSKYNRYTLFRIMIDKLPTLFDPHEIYAEVMNIYRSTVQILGESNLGKPCRMFTNEAEEIWYRNRELPIGLNCRMLGIWRVLIRDLQLDRKEFAEWFRYEYRLEKLAGGRVSEGLETEDYFRAYDEDVIPKDVLMEYLLDTEKGMPQKMREVTAPGRCSRGRKRLDTYPWAEELINAFLDRIVTVEEKRGEMPTVLTEHCLAIERFEGAHHFCNLLAALGKESFFRGYLYSDTTKKAVLSSLLKRCYPAKGDSVEQLAELIRKTDISEKRLVEAVMYAPQWAGFAEEILGWTGLKCGVWFFHAHINEDFSAEKETEVAIYSPISPQQFNDGAFDKNWFIEAYGQLGEKRFQTLYKSAKYITSGSNQHRRSQLYSDAVLGRLDAGKLQEEITAKRNQEKLRAYPLIPMEKGDKKEALRRYEFIQKFLKESKQFGAQRRESEKKACATALENLAITTGLMDVNRLMWQMESEKLEEIKPLMEPVELDDILVRLNIDENGDAGIVMEKGGKVIKTVPKALAKNNVVLEMKATIKELKEQKRRSRESLERAMMESTEFAVDELANILRNPILAPMVERLVWITGEEIGFPVMTDDELRLETPDGIQLPVGEKLRLAHPHDLKTAGVWAEFMHLLYEKKCKQPFKQVFREYYPLTEDERQERTISRRYAGHQVQPGRTVALLKSRGWTVDYEEGLQKVFYKENLIVRMFAMAEWFSPADIEAPTLETVEFFDRCTGENVPLDEVPPILFSETMRDLDLVVSVAHVGGVDPEASHSTVEMRVAIATELAALLRLSNVSWIGSHAKIHGSMANYSVHMGSGVVHAEGAGMISILPVHSQARGRIFLPFADDDPRTAEIMSKIILLAEDEKIKDASILRQIR